MRGSVSVMTLTLSVALSSCGPFPGTDPCLAIDPEVLHLPGATEGGAVTAPLTLFNAGWGVLTIDSVRLVDSNGIGEAWSIVSDSDGAELQPEESRRLEIRHTPVAGVSGSARLLIQSNDPDRPSATVDLLGLPSRPILVVTPARVDFGRVPSGGDSSREILIQNMGRATARALGLAGLPADSDFSAGLRANELAPGASVSMMVHYSPRGGNADRATLWIRSQTGSAEVTLEGSQDLKPPE